MRFWQSYDPNAIAWIDFLSQSHIILSVGISTLLKSSVHMKVMLLFLISTTVVYLPLQIMLSIISTSHTSAQFIRRQSRVYTLPNSQLDQVFYVTFGLLELVQWC